MYYLRVGELCELRLVELCVCVCVCVFTIQYMHDLRVGELCDLRIVELHRREVIVTLLQFLEQRLVHQHLCICTSKASKLSTICTSKASKLSTFDERLVPLARPFLLYQ